MRFLTLPRRGSPRRLFIRNLEGPDLFLSFLLSAVGAILAIRFFLHLTGYPQVGGGGLHIAHMLWGGVLLLAALVLFLGFLDRYAHRAAAILGGLGWGTFIDELGKFITQDHNYFYEPTVALIYLSFVGLYLAFQTAARSTQLTDDEYEANAMRVIEDALVHGLTEDRRARAQAYLRRTRAAEPMAVAVADLLSTMEALPSPPPWLGQRLHGWLRPRYARLVRHSAFRTGLELFFGLHAVAGVSQAVALAGSALHWVEAPPATYTFADLGHLACSSLAGLLVIAGIMRLRFSRRAAYQHFRTSVLVSLLLTEFFVFLQAQFAALPGFVLNVVVLAGLEELIEQEAELTGEAARPRSRSGSA